MKGQCCFGCVKVYTELRDGAVELVVFVGVNSYLLLCRVKLNAEIGDRAPQIIDVGTEQTDIAGCLYNLGRDFFFEVIERLFCDG